MAGSAAAPGFAPALLRLFDELQGEAHRAAGPGGRARGSDRAQARELVALYAAYRAALDARRARGRGGPRPAAALDGLRAAPERWGGRAGLPLRLRRLHGPRAAGDRDARRRRRRRGHGRADVRGRASGVRRPGADRAAARALARSEERLRGARPSTTPAAAHRAAPPRAQRCSPPTRRPGSIPARRSRCSRRAASAPSSSSSRPRRSTCCAPACRRRRSPSSCATRRTRPRSSPSVFAAYGVPTAVARGCRWPAPRSAARLLGLLRCCARGGHEPTTCSPTCARRACSRAPGRRSPRGRCSGGRASGPRPGRGERWEDATIPSSTSSTSSPGRRAAASRRWPRRRPRAPARC